MKSIMALRRRLPAGFRRLFRLPMSAARLQRELDDEIRFHLEMRAADLHAAGLSSDDARTAALTRFGDPNELRDYCERMGIRRARRRGVGEWLAELGQDLRFGTRQLMRAPGFTATAVVMAALGIGANTAIFSVIHHLILAPLPFANGERMVLLTTTANGGTLHIEPARSEIDLWRARSRHVDHILPVAQRRATLGDTSVDTPENGWVVSTVPGALAFVRARPALGRDLVAEDTLTGAPLVALIGDGVWRQRFGAEASVLGKSIALSGEAHTIIGVLPPGFALPFVPGNGDRADVVTALRHSSADTRVSALALLRPASTATDADRELAALFVDGAAPSGPPDDYRRTKADVPRVTTGADLLSSGYRQVLLVLFGAVGFVLLIACANIANLLLARAWARQREFAVRLALGASRARLARQMLTESVTLGLAGGVVGIGVGAAALRLMIAMQPRGSTELDGARLEPAVLAWSLAVAAVTGLLFGAAPALFASGNEVADSLKTASATAAGGRAARRFRGMLVIVEVALSVVLLAGAGLLTRTLVAMNRADTGFQPHGLTGMAVALSGARYTDPGARRSAFTALLERARATPGITGAAYALVLPPRNALGTAGLHVEGISSAETDTMRFYGVQAVTPDFFAVAGIPIVRGRLFSTDPASSVATGAEEILISETFARRFWPGGNPLGARVRQGTAPWARVVGVVPDVHAPGGPRNDGNVQLYELLPASAQRATLIVRGASSPVALSARVREAARDVDPSLKLRRDAVSVEAEMDGALSFYRFMLALLGTFAGLALSLAAIGLYGVISYSVSQRTREMGVRVALGARASDVLRMVLAQALRLSALGIGAGVALAIAMTRSIRGLLYGVEPGDPLTLVAVAALIGVVALVASYAPARRAASIDPVDALRAD